jgi:hypothetical protein
MRLLFPVALALSAFATQLLAAPAATERKNSLTSAGECRDASKQFARKGGIWRYDPVKPKKLTELPPAETYAAVYRLDERGCMVPVKYRDVRR